MDDARQYKISTFPDDGNLWRIDWMGGIRLNPHARSEQLITVFLTRLGVSNETSRIDPLSNKSLTKEHKLADIGVGLLPLVWIGSVWRNGHFVENNIEYSIGRFDVNTTQAIFTDLSSTVDKNDVPCRVIPAFQYPLGIVAWGRVKNSPLMALPYKNDPMGLLIPAIEVIRFYYIYSSHSARAIFFGKYADLQRKPAVYETGTGVVKILLHWPARQSDAWLLARYKSSLLMQERAKQIHKWVQLESINQFASNPSRQSFFPFDGKTNLTAVCRPIVGEDGKERFLAVRLKRCTAVMPFTDVELEIEDRPDDPVEAEDRKPIWGKIWPYGLEDNAKNFNNSKEPDKTYFPINIGVFEERFAALDGKKLVVVRKISDKPKASVVVRQSENKKIGVGTSDGTYGESDTAKGNVIVDVTSQEDGSRKTDLDSFISALAFLRRKTSRTVTTIPVGAGSDPYNKEIVSHFQVGNSVHRWTSIGIRRDAEGGEKLVPRRLIVAEIWHGQKVGYAMEIERKPGKNETISILILTKNDHTKMTPDEFDIFINQCINHNRWPTRKNMRSYRRGSVTHRPLPDENLGERMAAALKAIGV